MDKFFEKIARMNTAVKLAILVGVVVVIFAGFYFGMAGGSSAKGDEERERANLKRAKQEFSEAERSKIEEKRQCEKLKKKLKRAKRKMRRFRGMLPNDPQVSSLIKEIKAKLSGLALVEYVRGEEKFKKIYSTIPLDLTVVGPFHSAVKFFHEVSVMPRIVNVTNVSMIMPELKDGKTNVTLSFRVSTFRYINRGRRRRANKKSGKGRGRKKR